MSVVSVPVGATSAMLGPKLENCATSSKLLPATTVNTAGSDSSSSAPRLRLSLPAANTTSVPNPPRPCVCTTRMASASGCGTVVASVKPQLLEATAAPESRTNWNASMSAEIGTNPPPLSSSNFTQT